MIPLHTIGGVGIADAGLATLLAWLGVPLASAAGATLVLRAVVLLVPMMFWLLVMLLTRKSASP